MSWAEEKAKAVIPEDGFPEARATVLTVIRETIAKCAQAVPLEGHAFRSAAEVSADFAVGFKAGVHSAQRAIRKLGEP